MNQATQNSFLMNVTLAIIEINQIQNELQAKHQKLIELIHAAQFNRGESNSKPDLTKDGNVIYLNPKKAGGVMSPCKMTSTPSLDVELIKIYQPVSSIFENADSALIRAIELSGFLNNAAILAEDSNYHALSFAGVAALSESLSNDLKAVRLMLHELAKQPTASQGG